MRELRRSIDTAALSTKTTVRCNPAAIYRAFAIASLFVALLLLLITDAAFGIIANPDPAEHRQPDGSVITIYLKGDEHLHWNEDETGFAIVRSADKRFWYYAREENGMLVPTIYTAGSVDPEAVGLVKPDISKLRIEPHHMPQSDGEPDMLMAPPTGTMYNLVLLVNFSDLTITNTTQEFNGLFNQIGYTTDGATGSVRDFFDETTYNQLNVVSTVVEPVTLSNGYAYYGANDGYGNDIRPREMVSEALAALEARGFDFSTMDSDGDSWIDGLTVIHAGGGEEYSGNDPDYIWSHQWALISTVVYDGIRMRPYHTEPARRGWDNDPSSWGITRIGVICHETAHFIGLPDLYDYGYDSRGAGRFCLMAGGSWNGDGGATPAHPSGWCKVDRGWITPTEITGSGFYSLNQIETNQQIYKLQGAFPSNEYFLVENRQGVGFDAELPGTDRGILIWHVDENQSNNNDQTHYLVDLEEASGTQHLELNQNSGTDEDYFRDGNATEFSGTTVPNNNSYAGNPLGIDISNVGMTGSLMTLVVNGLTLEVVSPNGGEILPVGDMHEISWTIAGDTPDSVNIFLSLDSGASYNDTVATGIVGVTTYDWTVPELPVTTARIRVIAYIDGSTSGLDASDDDFTILGNPYRYVSPAGGNIYPYSTPAWAAHTIPDALDAANPGDTIMVAASTYNGALVIDTALYLLGGWDSGFTTWDPATNVTTLLGSGSIISFMSNDPDPCGIEGFNITGGHGTPLSLPVSGTYGGGIFSYNSSPVIRGNTMSGNGLVSETSYSAGGAISCYNGTATIEDNVITGCFAQSGGGIYLYQTTATVSRNRISGSAPHALFSGAKTGGGIYALHSTITMEDNVIEENDGYSRGGGVAVEFTTASFSGDSISLNDCADAGGGVYSRRSPLTISHAVINRNTCQSSGGGIYHEFESVDIANTIIAQNEADIGGGGIYADSTWGGIVNNTIDRNSGGFVGGNVFIPSTVLLDVKNNLITYGSQNGFQANSLSGLTFQYNNCFGNTPSEVAAITPDTTNTSRNPHYADTASYDYHLAVHSGGIDGGDPVGAGDPDGSRADQGAFGGPAAAFAAPDYIQNLVATAVNDTTIQLSWDELLPGGLDYYAVYGDTVSGFVPGELLYLGSVPAGSGTFDHHPVGGCWFYRVSAVNAASYGGGYSNVASDCAAGLDLLPPAVTVIYPNSGELFEPGNTVDIQWEASDNRQIDSVSIYYSENNGADYILLASGEPNDSLYQWIAPDINSDSCLVMIVAYDPGLLTGEDASDAVFAINPVSTDVDDMPAMANLLEQNYPNPFNPITRIAFSIKKADRVSLRIYDVAGRLVRVLVERELPAGRYEEIWDGRDGSGGQVSSGVYFYRMVASNFVKTRKMVLLR
jgi:immune inhibitor A